MTELISKQAFDLTPYTPSSQTLIIDTQTMTYYSVKKAEAKKIFALMESHVDEEIRKDLLWGFLFDPALQDNLENMGDRVSKAESLFKNFIHLTFRIWGLLQSKGSTKVLTPIDTDESFLGLPKTTKFKYTHKTYVKSCRLFVSFLGRITKLWELSEPELIQPGLHYEYLSFNLISVRLCYESVLAWLAIHRFRRSEMGLLGILNFQTIQAIGKLVYATRLDVNLWQV